jgi:hypothetical protein
MLECMKEERRHSAVEREAAAQRLELLRNVGAVLRQVFAQLCKLPANEGADAEDNDEGEHDPGQH